jgi:alpha-tubulin suppressor-like RCC1 family protein
MQVYTWGLNDDYALGRHTEEEDDCFIPERVIRGLMGLIVIKVSAGDSHGAALIADGRVFIWGTFQVCINRN